MPDASGNLLGIDDFTNGRQVRFYSYLDPDVVMALTPENPHTCVHHLSSGAVPRQTVFTIHKAPGRPQDRFELSVAFEPGWDVQLAWLAWDDGSDSGTWLTNATGVPNQGPDMNVFTIDVVDGCWFALNNSDHTRVADVSGSGTFEGNEIIGFPWNGGPNQRWRAEIVAGSALGSDAEDAAAGRPVGKRSQPRSPRQHGSPAKGRPAKS